MERRPRIRLSLILVLGLIVTFLWGHGVTLAAKGKKISPGDKDQLTKFVTLLQDEKDRAENYVLRAKQIEEDDKREEARRLYETAETDFNQYVTHIFNGVRLGSSVDLRASAETARSSAAAFENYVADNTKTKSPTLVIAGAKTVLEMGMNIIDWFFGKGKTERAAQLQRLRHETADYWQPRLEWGAWEKISAGGH